ncbi:MAG: hypothetical protein ACXVLX_22170, partial [Ilumatobacteraceae bacterium]
ERITQNAQHLLEPGEQIQAVIPPQTKSGWLGALGFIWLIFLNRFRPIVVTDRRIAITDSGRWAQGKPTTIVASLARSTQIGPPQGLWWKCQSLGQPLYIHKRFHKDVEQADALRPTA